MTDPISLLAPIVMMVSSLLAADVPAEPTPESAVDPVKAEERRILECVGEHESNGNYGAVSPSGQYRGKYQMDDHFFLQYGGDPRYAGRHETAPPAMQDDVALAGYRARGLGPWPGTKDICG